MYIIHSKMYNEKINSLVDSTMGRVVACSLSFLYRSEIIENRSD